MSRPALVVSLVLAALAGGVFAAAVSSARAEGSGAYTCTAVHIPITKAKKTDDPEAVVEQHIPAGFTPIGGASGGWLGNGTGSITPYVIACKQDG